MGARNAGGSGLADDPGGGGGMRRTRGGGERFAAMTTCASSAGGGGRSAPLRPTRGLGEGAKQGPRAEVGLYARLRVRWAGCVSGRSPRVAAW